MKRAEAAVLARAAKAAKQPDLYTRFWSKVDKRGQDECWPWLAGLRSTKPGMNYGAFWMNGRHHPASRVALQLSGIEVPDGAETCHRCDNPPCCNPAHLFVGTKQDNNDDKVMKARHVHGDRVHTVKLTADQVREIRAMKPHGAKRMPHGLSKKIAKKFGITAQYISEILAYKSWRDV